MTREDLDEVDRQILSLLQRDARQTATEIGDAVGVSDTTVLNRIERLEEDEVLVGYRAVVDYERGGFQRPFLVTCSVPISERDEFAERILEVPGVVTVIECMTGRENLLVEAVGEEPEDVTRIARTIDELGVDVVDETAIRSVHHTPLEYLARGHEDARH